jgi:RNA-directed DNA polymerase
LCFLTAKHGFCYTRYGDDLTVSGNRRLLDFRSLICRIVEEDGFAVNPEKVRTMHAGMRQVVTKIVVNDKTNLPRETRRAIRSQVLQFANGRGAQISPAQMRGRLSWFESVNPRLGSKYKLAAGFR